MASGNGVQVLPPGAGYGIVNHPPQRTFAFLLSQTLNSTQVIGIGGVFAALMLCVTWLQNRYTSFSTLQAEEFNTASRSVKPGLIAAGIVSSWTWSATV